MKSTATGYWTPEFILTVLVDIAAAIIAILIARGLLNSDEGELWVSLVKAIAVPLSILIAGWTTSRFIDKQAAVRMSLLESGRDPTD